MSRKPVVNDWAVGRLFGVTVLRGEVEGRRICARLLWGSHGRFGITRESQGSEEVLAEGRQSVDAWGLAE